MKGAITYLNFDGNCRDAMIFYGKCLQADPNFTPFSAGPPELPPVVKTAPDRILHAETDKRTGSFDGVGYTARYVVPAGQ